MNCPYCDIIMQEEEAAIMYTDETVPIFVCKRCGHQEYDMGPDLCGDPEEIQER